MNFRQNPVKIQPRSSSVALALIAFLIGMAFIYLTPPWWHHDEPGHFQVAWFFSEHGKFPAQEEVDLSMRLDLARSLDENGFYDLRNYRYNKYDAAPWVMSPQSEDPKLSYLLGAFALKLFHPTHLADQLILLRWISLFYFVSLTLLIQRFALELFPDRPTIGFFAGFFFTLLPGAANQMTAVSNEPLGALLFTAFLFFTYRAIRRKPITKGLVPQITTAALLFFTITTVWIVVPLVLMVTLATLLLSKKSSRAAVIAIGVLSIAAIFLLFDLSEARFWYQQTVTAQPARTRTIVAPDSDLALSLKAGQTVRQRIPQAIGGPLSGSNAVFGFYAWADQKTSVDLKNVVSIKYATFETKKILLTTEPVWYTIPLTMADEVGVIKVTFSFPKTKDPELTIHFSTPTLAAGMFSDSPPTYTDRSLSQGTWDGQAFTNLIRNAALTSVWPRFSPTVAQWLEQELPVTFNQTFLTTLLDPASSGWYFSRTVDSLVRTYWGKLGASNYDLIGGDLIYPLYTLLSVAVSLIGFFEFWRARHNTDRPFAFVCFLSLTLIWSQTILRGASSLEADRIVIPWSRYASTTFPLISILTSASLIYFYDRAKHSMLLARIYTSLLFSMPIGLSGSAILSLLAIFHFPGRATTILGLIQGAMYGSLFAFFTIPIVQRTVAKIILDRSP